MPLLLIKLMVSKNYCNLNITSFREATKINSHKKYSDKQLPLKLKAIKLLLASLINNNTCFFFTANTTCLRAVYFLRCGGWPIGALNGLPMNFFGEVFVDVTFDGDLILGDNCRLVGELMTCNNNWTDQPVWLCQQRTRQTHRSIKKLILHIFKVSFQRK